MFEETPDNQDLPQPDPRGKVPTKEKDRDEWDWLAFGYGYLPRDILLFMNLYTVRLDPYAAAFEAGINAHHVARLIEEEPVKLVMAARVKSLEEIGKAVSADAVRGLAFSKAKRFSEFSELNQSLGKEGAKKWLKDILDSL